MEYDSNRIILLQYHILNPTRQSLLGRDIP
jgi:hypothetical protein